MRSAAHLERRVACSPQYSPVKELSEQYAGPSVSGESIYGEAGEGVTSRSLSLRCVYVRVRRTRN